MSCLALRIPQRAPCCICHPWLLPMLPNNSKTLSALWKGVGCVWVQISSQDMTMGEGRRKDYNDFSLRMSSSLSKRWVCVVENLSRVFLSKWPLIYLWVMRLYIVWVKGKEVTHKNPPGRMFCDCLVGRPYSRDTRENDSLARLFSFHLCAPHVLFRGLASHEINWFFI